MKKISYYVAAFALCCGVSQTLTSCIEETEEPDDVKALRQAEIAKVNADAEYVKAQAAAENATAAKTNAEAEGQKVANAIKEVEKAIAEGSSAEQIQAAIAEYKAAIVKQNNEGVSQNKEAATAFLPDQLDADAGAAWSNYVDAKNAYLGFLSTTTNTWVKGTVELLADAIQDTLYDADAIQDKKQTILDLQAQVDVNNLALDKLNKAFDDWKNDYEDEKTVAGADESTMKDVTSSNPIKKTDEDAKTEYAKAVKCWNYKINTLKTTNEQKASRLTLVKANKAYTDSEVWYSTVPAAPGVYQVFEQAQQDNEHAKTVYEEAKAKYEAAIAALKAINQ